MANLTRDEVTRNEVTIGTRIYYTGDMANESDWGTVAAFTEGARGLAVDVLYDSGQLYKGLPVRMIGHKYQGHCDPRHVTETAFKTWRDARRAELNQLRCTLKRRTA